MKKPFYLSLDKKYKRLHFLWDLESTLTQHVFTLDERPLFVHGPTRTCVLTNKDFQLSKKTILEFLDLVEKNL